MEANEHILWRLFITNCRMGVRSAIKGLDYYRAREYLLLLNMMGRKTAFEGKMVLDLACGEEVLPVFLSREIGRNIHAIDLDMGRIFLQAGFFRRLLKDNPHINLTRGDALVMGYKSGSFDVVINLAMISLLEGDGDIRLVREIARILRPGGTTYISLGYSESAREGYDPSAKVFFRYYDEASLAQRITCLRSGLFEIQRRYFGEPSFRFGPLWYRSPFWFKVMVRWASPLPTFLFCRELAKSRARHATGILLALQKPLDPQS